MAVRIFSKFCDKLVPLLLGLTTGVRASVSLIDDDAFGRLPNEIVAPGLRLDVVERDDGDGVAVEDGFASGEIAFETFGGGGENQGSVEVEFAFHFPLPLLGELRRAENGDAADFAAIEKLAGDEKRFDSFTDTDVISDQEADCLKAKSHQKRHQLVGTRLHCNATKAAEWTDGTAEAQASSIAEELTGEEVAGLAWIRERRIV